MHASKRRPVFEGRRELEQRLPGVGAPLEEAVLSHNRILSPASYRRQPEVTSDGAARLPASRLRAHVSPFFPAVRVRPPLSLTAIHRHRERNARCFDDIRTVESPAPSAGSYCTELCAYA
jgi:hypothetical protein